MSRALHVAICIAMTVGLVVQVAAVLLANVALHGMTASVVRDAPVVGSLMLALLVVTSLGSSVVWKRTVLDPFLRHLGDRVQTA